MVGYCWKCGEPVNLQPGARIGARDACSRCDSDLHSCRNCRFYDPSKNNQCAEAQAEWVRDKEAANYCDYFQLASRGAQASSGSDPTQGDVRKKFDSLFRK